MPDEEMVTITKREYEELKTQTSWLTCLEAAGVDNWDGYSEAGKLWRGDDDE